MCRLLVVRVHCDAGCSRPDAQKYVEVGVLVMILSGKLKKVQKDIHQSIKSACPWENNFVFQVPFWFLLEVYIVFVIKEAHTESEVWRHTYVISASERLWAEDHCEPRMT